MEQPNMMTVREIARTGLLSEHALRLMLKAGKLPAIYIGKKALINYDKLCSELQGLDVDFAAEPAHDPFLPTLPGRSPLRHG
jgi:hypothetical protein